MAKKTVKKSKLRIAFIGAGGIAASQMRALVKFPDAQVVALSDVNEKGMLERATEFNVPKEHCFTDYHEMLKKVDCDAVSVCTPNGMHAPASIAASKAGKDVIVEKPLAMNAKEGQAMLDAAKKAKKKLVIGFQYRFDPRTTYLRNAVKDGQFGKVLYARCQALRRRGIPNWGVFGRKDLQGGGPMIDIGVHIIEAAHFTMGSPKPVAATGQTFTYIGDKKSDIASQWPNWDHKTYTVEDLAVGQIRFDNGAVLSIESSFAGHLKDNFNFVIMGEKGGGDWDAKEIYTDNAGFMTNANAAWLPPSDFTTVFTHKLRNFVDHCLYNKPTLAPAEHGLMVQKMLDGVYESAAKGKEVTIK